MWQELIEMIDGIRCDAPECRGAVIAAEKRSVATTDSNAAKGPLGCIVVDFQIAILAGSGKIPLR